MNISETNSLKTIHTTHPRSQPFWGSGNITKCISQAPRRQRYGMVYPGNLGIFSGKNSHPTRLNPIAFKTCWDNVGSGSRKEEWLVLLAKALVRTFNWAIAKILWVFPARSFRCNYLRGYLRPWFIILTYVNEHLYGIRASKPRFQLASTCNVHPTRAIAGPKSWQKPVMESDKILVPKCPGIPRLPNKRDESIPPTKSAAVCSVVKARFAWLQGHFDIPHW